MIRIDPGTRSYLVICECGYRDITTSRAIALAVAARHEAHAHTDQVQARKAARQWTRRHTDQVPGCTDLIPTQPHSS